jgi:hypothetical protein
MDRNLEGGWRSANARRAILATGIPILDASC